MALAELDEESGPGHAVVGEHRLVFDLGRVGEAQGLNLRPVTERDGAEARDARVGCTLDDEIGTGSYKRKPVPPPSASAL